MECDTVRISDGVLDDTYYVLVCRIPLPLGCLCAAALSYQSRETLVEGGLLHETFNA